MCSVELADVVKLCSDTIYKQSLLFPFLYSECVGSPTEVWGEGMLHITWKGRAAYVSVHQSHGKDAVGVKLCCGAEQKKINKSTIEHVSWCERCWRKVMWLVLEKKQWKNEVFSESCRENCCCTKLQSIFDTLIIYSYRWIGGMGDGSYSQQRQKSCSMYLGITWWIE